MNRSMTRSPTIPPPAAASDGALLAAARQDPDAFRQLHERYADAVHGYFAEPTVDQNQKVDGGCRSLNGAGTEWECCLGETAVHQKIIGQGVLGQPVSGPGVG